MKPPKLFLRTRIFLSMIFLVLISFLLTGIVTNYQIRESSDYYHGLRLERKEAQIQRALRSLLEERSLLEDNQLSFYLIRDQNKILASIQFLIQS